MEKCDSWRGMWRSLIHETSSHGLSTASPAIGTASSYKYLSRHTWTIIEQVRHTACMESITKCPLPGGFSLRSDDVPTYGGRGQLKCDGTRAEIRFRPSAKRTSPFKSAGGCQLSRLLAAEVCASAVVMLDTPCSEVV